MRKSLPGALLLVAVVLILLGAGLFTGAADRPAIMAPPDPSPTCAVAELPPPPVEVVTPSPEPSAEAQPIPSPEPNETDELIVSPALSPISVDISNPTMYRKLNIFLSNFSEVKFPQWSKTFSAQELNYGEIIEFAGLYAERNDKQKLEDIGYGVNEDGDLFMQVSLDGAKSIARRFFGDVIDFAKVEEAWKEGNGIRPRQDDAPCYGFILVDSVRDLDENRFEANFHVYTVPYAEYRFYDSAASSAVYSATPDNLPKPLDPPAGAPHAADHFTAIPGAATFQAEQAKDGTISFYLRSYEVDEWY